MNRWDCKTHLEGQLNTALPNSNNSPCLVTFMITNSLNISNSDPYYHYFSTNDENINKEQRS